MAPGLQEIECELRGWSAYFCLGARLSAYLAIDRHVTERIRMFLSKRSKVRERGTRKFLPDKVFRELSVKRLKRWGEGLLPIVLP